MTEEQLNAIKARRAALPYAPWGAAEEDVMKRDQWRIGNEEASFFAIRSSFFDGEMSILSPAQLTAVAAFTTHAPSDIDALLSENARLRAALEEYADEKSWMCLTLEGSDPDELIKDVYAFDRHGYARAQQALEGDER